MSCRGWSSDAYWAGRIVWELERQGQDVTLACRPGAGKVEAGLRALGVRRLTHLEMARGLAPVLDLRDLKSLRRLVARVDLVHVHRGKEHWLAAIANRLIAASRPLVRTRHIVLPVKAHRLNRWLYAQTDLVVTVADRHRDHYLRTGLVPPERLLTLRGGVDAWAFSPAADGRGFRHAVSLAPRHHVVGVVARLRPMKGHRTFLEAMSRLAAQDPHLRILVVGDGPRGPELRELSQAFGLGDRVKFLGQVERVPAAMAALDVAVYPSDDSEGMSRVLFEYMAAARAIVATRVGLAPEVLTHGESALLVPPGEAVPLAAAIRRLLDDRALAARLGSAARQLVEAHYTGEVVAGNLLAHYRRLTRR